MAAKTKRAPKLDPRITPARKDLAAEALRGKVEAERFVEPAPHVVNRARVALRPRPERTATLDTVLLFGEPFDVYDVTDGWAWGQSGLDGFVGYLPESAVIPAQGQDKTHMVCALGCQMYDAPKLKLPPIATMPFGARVRVTETKDRYSKLASGAWVPAPLLRALDAPEKDWVAVAERFLHVPYVWGGRSSNGIDCSGLVQLALQSAGANCPRDSDMQEDALGETLEGNADLQRGDLIFWKGHVGIMADAETLLHANAHHMCVAVEPLTEATARISKSGDGEITRRARLDAALNPA